MKKHILITGSTDGIGKLTALKLASEGHVVYLHGRNSKKLKNTIDELKEESNNKEIYGFIADFSNLEDIKQMTKQIKKQVKKLDILINNAGIFKSPESHAKNGFDLRYMVNYIAPFILTNELLPLIQQSNEARIINLSSAAQSEVSLDVMQGIKSVSINESYAQSKLALTMWNHHLASQLNNITTIAVNPGSLLNTKMANEAYGQYWAPADKGVKILYNLALGKEHKSHSGEYFDNDSGRYANAHADTYNKSAVDALISFTNNLIL